MKAWRLRKAGEPPVWQDEPAPRPKPAGVVVRMEATPVLSYMRQVLEGKLGYALPRPPFIPGTNGIGVIEAIGSDVRHLQVGQRVSLDPYFMANERVAEPAQILIGLTAMSASRFGDLDPATLAVQAEWPDGTFAEVAHLPAAVATPLPPPLDAAPAPQVAALSKFVVPYGGFLRGAFQAGEVAIVNGASGYFGAAGVLVALAMGAARVVAAGRDRAALERLATAAGARVSVVGLVGDAAENVKALRDAAGGGADFALDMVGRANSAASTLAALRALRRGGRLILMGSVAEPLSVGVGEMLANNWAVIGNFMYPKDAPARLAALMAAGLLDATKVNVRAFPLSDLDAAMTAAAAMRGLDMTVLAAGGR